MSVFTPLFRMLGALAPVPVPPPGPVVLLTPGLQKPAPFFAALRQSGLFGTTLSQDEVSGLNAVVEACASMPLAYAAYALATAYHETAHSLQPVKECGGDGYFTRMYDPEGLRPEVAARLGNCKPGDGALFCGRGYVQLTGRGNYAKAGKVLGCDLEAQPDMALRDDVAAEVLRQGMADGWFTGKSFASFLPSDKPATRDQFINARRIINGTDRAELIAGYALTFQAALQAGEWA